MLSRDLIYAMNDINDRYLEDARGALGYTDEKKPHKSARRISRIFLLAALISVLLIGTAFAAGLFTLRERRPAESDETYTIHWSDSPSGKLVWKDLKYVFQFDGLEECRAVRFKPGWLPFEPDPEINAWARDDDGWYTRLVSEGTPEAMADPVNYQPYMINVYYVPQFTAEDGAMLLMDQTPGEITEERQGDETILSFPATKHLKARWIDEEHNSPEQDLHYSFVIRFSEREGYIIVIAGTSDMETIAHIARELEIRPTEEIVRSSDFENHAVFIDVGVG